MPPKRKKQPPERERHRVWVAAGGRCTICGKYLLEGALTKRPFRLGELAHIVGQQNTPGSPRGTAEVMSETDRDRAENLMLVCAGEHQEIDRNGVLDLLQVQELRAIKAKHEDWIRRVTGLRPDDTTVVVRLLGDVRGRAVELDRATATAAVIRGDARWPDFPLTYAQDGVEIDLRQLPGEDPATDAYWSAAVAKIDGVLERLKEGVRDGRSKHVSVFAFARLPLLVHLGSRLDDAYGVSIYQRHRSTQGWDWPDGASDTVFGHRALAGHDDKADEAVLLINASGTVRRDELPDALRALPVYVVAPDDVTPHTDTVASPASLISFETAVRAVLADVEATHKQVRRLHVIAAAPLSAAVVLGRVRDPHVHPSYVLYDRADSGYRPVLEIA